MLAGCHFKPPGIYYEVVSAFIYRDKLNIIDMEVLYLALPSSVLIYYRHAAGIT